MKTNCLWIALVLIAALVLAGCGSDVRVGALQTTSQSVELGDAKSVRVEINLGAGDLKLAGGAAKLLQADFTYNVANFKPEVGYSHDTLVVQQPNVDGMPVLQGIGDYRNEWGLQLSDQVPMDLKVDIGGGTSDLQLAGLSLSRLDVTLGAGTSTVDLDGDWVRDLNVTIDAGAADVTVRLPKDIGVRIVTDPGAALFETHGLAQNEGVYTNAAYGASNVTLQLDVTAGIGRVNLEVVEQ